MLSCLRHSENTLACPSACFQRQQWLLRKGRKRCLTDFLLSEDNDEPKVKPSTFLCLIILQKIFADALIYITLFFSNLTASANFDD